MPSGRDWLILLNITYKKTKSVITTVLAFLLTNLLSTIHYSFCFHGAKLQKISEREGLK